MQTADIAKSTQCCCERIWAADFARSAPLPLMPFSARSAPFSAPLTLRSHALSETREMSQNSKKIWPYSSTRSSSILVSMESPCTTSYQSLTVTTLCSEKKHPLTFSSISPWVMRRF